MFSTSKFFAGSLFALSAFSMAATPVVLYKDANCGCCENYVHYLNDNGFKVNAVNFKNMEGIKKSFGSDQLASCHTMIIQGYTVEGHVPVAAIRKLLKEKPQIVGISLPGMDAHSPGMGPEIKGSLRILQIVKKQTGPAPLFSVE